MTYQININLDNSALDGDTSPELVRILGNLINSIESGTLERTLRDINGNVVGCAELVD